MNFKKGDFVEFINLTGDEAQYNGTRCTVVSGPVECYDGPNYEVDIQCPHEMPEGVPESARPITSWMAEGCLKLVPGDEDEASWETIEDLVEWNPNKVLVT